MQSSFATSSWASCTSRYNILRGTLHHPRPAPKTKRHHVYDTTYTHFPFTTRDTAPFASIKVDRHFLHFVFCKYCTPVSTGRNHFRTVVYSCHRTLSPVTVTTATATTMHEKSRGREGVGATHGRVERELHARVPVHSRHELGGARSHVVL